MDNQFGNDFNNQYGYNPNNQYDPNMNQYQGGQVNQYGQQQMMDQGMNQQPMYDQGMQQPMYDQSMVQQQMMSQQQMYDPNMVQQPIQQPVPQPMFDQNMQQPMQADPNAGMFNGQNIVRENPRGGGPLGIVVAVGLVILLVVFLLEYSGTTNLTGLFNKDKNTTTEKAMNASDVESKKELTVDYKDKVEKLCSKIDTSGNYNTEEYTDITQKMNSGSYSDPDLIWGLFKGKEYCVNNSCAIYQDNEEHTSHFYDCSKQEYNTGVFEDFFGNTLAESICYYIDEEGNYTDSKGNEFCKDYICSITYSSKVYKKSCPAK